MRQTLKLHPMSHSVAVDGIETEVSRADKRFIVSYRLSGRVADLVLPAQTVPVRTDELWRHTCFEAFVGDGAGGYAEFNFAPSGQWAAYRFDAYRQGMRLLELEAPQITVSTSDNLLELTAAFEVPGGAAQLALSAVIEEAGETVSYWALAHPPGKADFHHADCFALDLAASGRP